MAAASGRSHSLSGLEMHMQTATLSCQSTFVVTADVRSGSDAMMAPAAGCTDCGLPPRPKRPQAHDHRHDGHHDDCNNDHWINHIGIAFDQTCFHLLITAVAIARLQVFTVGRPSMLLS